eukprot:1130629-Prymnesium_polylepis.1
MGALYLLRILHIAHDRGNVLDLRHHNELPSQVRAIVSLENACDLRHCGELLSDICRAGSGKYACVSGHAVPPSASRVSPLVVVQLALWWRNDSTNALTSWRAFTTKFAGMILWSNAFSTQAKLL